MKHSEFDALVVGEFGAEYGSTIISDHVVLELEDRTPRQAIAAGVDPKEVWFALCRSMGVPKDRWWGVDSPMRQKRVPK